MMMMMREESQVRPSTQIRSRKKETTCLLKAQVTMHSQEEARKLRSSFLSDEKTSVSMVGIFW